MRQDGYTILEALCAFAILAVVLVVLYSVGGTTSRLLAGTEASDEAALFAQSKLAELASMRAPLPEHEAGRFTGTEFRWRIGARDALPGQNRFPQYRLQEVALTVFWPEPGGSASFALQTAHFGIGR